MQLTKKEYNELVRQAKIFAAQIKGDAGFDDSGVNRVALEHLLCGWLTTTRTFRSYAAMVKRRNLRDNPLLILQDQALQAADDAVGSDPFFAVKEDTKGKAIMVRDLLNVALAAQKLRIAQEEYDQRFHSATLANQVKMREQILDNWLLKLQAIQEP